MFLCLICETCDGGILHKVDNQEEGINSDLTQKHFT